MNNDQLDELYEKCMEHADFLDDCGNDGDGEDVRNLARVAMDQRAIIQNLRESLDTIRSKFLVD